MPSPEMVRRGEYAARGDYHRTPDPSWDYYPTYIAKLDAVRRLTTPQVEDLAQHVTHMRYRIRRP